MEAENVGEEGDGGGEVRAVSGLGGWAVSATAVLLTAYPPDRLSAQDTTAGKRVYVKWCAGCHGDAGAGDGRSEEHTSELQSQSNLVCRLLLAKKENTGSTASRSASLRSSARDASSPW